MEPMETVSVPDRRIPRCCSVGRIVNLFMAFLLLVIVAIAAGVIGMLGTLIRLLLHLQHCITCKYVYTSSSSS